MENQIVVALKGFILNKGRALIIKRSRSDAVGAGLWEFAGGKLEFGEKLEEALLREIKEETGLDVIVDKLLYATEFKSSPDRQVVILNYLCVSLDDNVSLSEEHTDFLWANEEQLRGYLDKPILDDITKEKIFDILFLL